MPSGYTADIARGITFEEFVCQCARAFGALINLRDEPLSPDIPDEIQPSDYHKKALKEAEEEYEKALKLTITDAVAFAAAEYKAECLHYDESVKERAELKQKYYKMLQKAKAWNPPTPEHEGLKKFMIEQIEQSINWDCSVEYLKFPKLKTPIEWLENHVKDKLWGVNYHREENEKEIKRAKERTEWIKALKNSLKEE